jgi:phage I-like protein
MNKEIESSIFNRFKPSNNGWIHIAPLGLHPHKDGTQKVEESDVELMINAFRSAGARPILVDYDHTSHDETKGTEAGGWIEDLQLRNDGIWGKVRWSADGEEKVKNGTYRYTSPVWGVTRDADGFLRPISLKDVALTNQPNLKGLQPISNRASGDNSNGTETKNKTSMKGIAKALGLDSESTEEQIIQVANRLMADNAAAKAKLTGLEVEVQNSRKADAERIASDHKIEGDNKDKFVAAFLLNREVALSILETLPKVDAAAPTGQKPLTNRATAATPIGSDFSSAADQAKQEKLYGKIFNRARAIQSSEGVNWNTAFDRATNELDG